jgi:hypothetical protein
VRRERASFSWPRGLLDLLELRVDDVVRRRALRATKPPPASP